MAMDEDVAYPVNTEEDPGCGVGEHWQDKTPTGQDTSDRLTGNQDPTPAQDDDIFVEVDEAENAKTLARIMNIDESPSENFHPSPPHPHDKFTKGEMPEIFDEDPATLLAGIEKAQLQSWLALPTGKVLARPFDIEVRYRPNHNDIANTIRTAVKEITGAAKVTVAKPRRDPSLTRDGPLKFPVTFLIHDISKKDVEMLLERSVWSSKEITFQVSSIYIKRPEFLFTMEGMTTDNTEHVLSCIEETWSDATTSKFVHKLVAAATSREDQQNRLGEIMEFLGSVRVRHLDVRNEGGKENPHFNIYADGEIIRNNTTWLELRRFLRQRAYRSNNHGDGKATESDFVCSLCHGHDHPRGLCAFPHIPDWNGGGRNPKRYPTQEPYNTTDYREFGHNFTQMMPRARGGHNGRGNYIRGRGRGRGSMNVTSYPPY